MQFLPGKNSEFVQIRGKNTPRSEIRGKNRKIRGKKDYITIVFFFSRAPRAEIRVKIDPENSPKNRFSK